MCQALRHGPTRLTCHQQVCPVTLCFSVQLLCMALQAWLALEKGPVDASAVGCFRTAHNVQISQHHS